VLLEELLAKFGITGSAILKDATSKAGAAVELPSPVCVLGFGARSRYPSHVLLALMHRLQRGFPSSHLTWRFLFSLLAHLDLISWIVISLKVLWDLGIVNLALPQAEKAYLQVMQPVLTGVPQTR